MTQIEGGSNIYSYLRTKDGAGKECNAIAVPVGHKPGLVYLLTFVELMSSVQPNWQSKDLLLLFYEESDYSFAVEEFLQNYYMDPQLDYPFAGRVHGRCGYIRQSFPLVIRDYDFGKISLVLDAPNSQLSDIDFYDALRQAIETSQSFTYDLAYNYYRKNTYITHFQENAAAVVGWYLTGLEHVLNYF